MESGEEEWEFEALTNAAGINLRFPALQINIDVDELYDRRLDRVELRDEPGATIVWLRQPFDYTRNDYDPAVLVRPRLSEFCQLHGKTDEQILEYVRRNGVLSIDAEQREEWFCSAWRVDSPQRLPAFHFFVKIDKDEVPHLICPGFTRLQDPLPSNALETTNWSDYHIEINPVLSESTGTYRWLSHRFRAILGLAADLLTEELPNEEDFYLLEQSYNYRSGGYGGYTFRGGVDRDDAEFLISDELKDLLNKAGVFPMISWEDRRSTTPRLLLGVDQNYWYTDEIRSAPESLLKLFPKHTVIYGCSSVPGASSLFSTLVLLLTAAITSASGVMRCGICGEPFTKDEHRYKRGTTPLCKKQACHTKANTIAKRREREKKAHGPE